MSLVKHRAVSLKPTAQIDTNPESFISTESSNIYGARYLPDTRVLVVCFKFEKTGGIKSVYSYENFPMKEWAKWVVAESKGVHFNTYIRPIFAAKRVA